MCLPAMLWEHPNQKQYSTTQNVQYNSSLKHLKTMTKKHHDQSKTNLAGKKICKGDKVERYGVNNAIEGRKIKFQGSMKLAVCGDFSYVCVFYSPRALALG